MLKIVCFFSTLARAEYDAKGTEHYEKAKRAHKQLCLECDEMMIPNEKRQRSHLTMGV
jgi:hypothetical protein